VGQISIAIIKRVAFRDSLQHFSNVYTYGSIDSNPIFGTGANLINDVVSAEKPLHSSAVTYIRGRMWSSGGTIAQNQMLTDIALTGTGNQPADATLDRERAVLVMWKAGKDSRGKPVYLRKWYHSCGSCATVAMSDPVKANTTSLSATQQGLIATQADILTRIGAGEEWGLIAASGRERDGGPPTVHRYLEHHQLGDEWRAV
jgi:hypothetical protein